MSSARAPTPDVSIIVLNYNGETFIRRCLDHLLAQTYGDFEVIVVENASTDGSPAILREYEKHESVHVIWSKTNHGVPGGRNVGVERARGRIIAFMDNDGYAAPTWLENALPLFEDDTVGAVASLVFFNKKKLIVNGAGGTLNLRGYGGDHCFRTSYEFARIPTDVLYPMGCGMLVRSSTMREIGPFDEIIFNYYDDVELGICVWNAGKRVVVAPFAWVDHEYGSSTSTNYQKMYLCERNRIRTVLKYYPLRHLPRWLLREREILRYLRWDGLRDIPLRAWTWNLRHLGSATAKRRAQGIDPGRYWGLFAPTWKQYPLPLPEEHVSYIASDEAGDTLDFGSEKAQASLLFGWYPAENDGRAFRWAATVASVLMRLDRRMSSLAIRAKGPGSLQTVRIVVRRLGDHTPVWSRHVSLAADGWTEVQFDCDIPSGSYEVLFLAGAPAVDAAERPLGLGVSNLAFSHEKSAKPTVLAAGA